MCAACVQGLIANQDKLPLEQLIGWCNQQEPSDSMLLFLRAVATAGLLANKEELFDLQIQVGFSATDATLDIR